MVREAVLEDTLACGVKTTEMLDSPPYSFRVEWIRWDSGFRQSGLAPGDRIVAVDGTRYERPQHHQLREVAVGQEFESRGWEAEGAADGRQVTLTIQRAAVPAPQTMAFTGRLRAERQWYDDDGRQIFGPGGPRRLTNDGFDESWMGWYENQCWFASRVLDHGWRGFVSNNLAKLVEHRATRERVDFLTKTYPGPFAEVVRADWDQVETYLMGRRYELTDAELAWRSVGPDPAPTAGESALLPDDEPHEVVAAFYGAVKAGDLARWQGLLASWDAARTGGRVEFREDGPPAEQRVAAEWERVRALVLGPVYDVRVVAVEEVETLLAGDEPSGVPRVDQVVVEVEHIGKLDEEYRAFIDHTLSRTSELQRINSGPWRVRSYPDRGWF